MVIINYLNDIKCIIENIAVDGRAYRDFFTLKDANIMCEDALNLLSIQEYMELSKLFESIELLLAEMKKMNDSNQDLRLYKLKYYANDILKRWEIYDVLCLKYNVKKGYLFNLIIDMDTFETRINALGIDCDIIQQQFSMDNFRLLIEQYKKQSCDNIIVIYKKETELLKRIAQSKKVSV